MVEDGRAARADFTKSCSDPVAGVGPLNSWAVSARQVDGAFQTGEALALIGPNIGPESQALGGVFEIDWRDVASKTLNHAR